MSASASLCFVPRDIRTNKANKRKHRYIDENMKRQEKLFMRAKRSQHFNEFDYEQDG